jgi:AraC-like DNA-binding protein
MKQDLSAQKLCLQALTTSLLPWLTIEEEVPILFAEPPFHFPPEVKVIGERPPLPYEKRTDRTKLFYHRWKQAEMKAIRYVLMGCVLEGEADYVIGGISDVSSGGEEDWTPQPLQVITLPKKSFFIIPPGIPHSDGNRYHWERPLPENAFSRIFWLLISPNGFLCHICTTQGTQHTSTNPIAVRDQALHVMARLLMEEMRLRDTKYLTIGRHLLIATMQRVCRGIERGEFLPSLPGWRGMHPAYPLPSIDDASQPKSNWIVEDVCRYIEEHIADPLTLQQIALYACVSPAYLNRLFRSSLGISVMKYVAHHRMEMAKQLLSGMDANVLPIRELSALVGFQDPAYFSRVFKKWEGVSPEVFRQHHQKVHKIQL